jgi:hypothetical protein
MRVVAGIGSRQSLHSFYSWHSETRLFFNGLLAGQLARKAIVHGTDRRVVRFTLETRSSREEGEQDRVGWVGAHLLRNLARLALEV